MVKDTEEEARVAARVAEMNQYHYLNIYKTIAETGLRPDGTPATDLEKKIAPHVVSIGNLAEAGKGFAIALSAYVGYQSYYGKPILGVDTNYLQTAKTKINEKLFKFDDISSRFKAIDTDTIPSQISSNTVPDYVGEVLEEIRTNKGNPPEGYKGGKAYNNVPKDGAQKLPEGVKYREYDVHPKVKGVTRGMERIVIGDDGSVWYTDDHYETFTKIE